VKGLGKKYTIGGSQEKYLTFRDAIVNSVKGPFRRLTSHGAAQSTNEFWALKDISFDAKKGEVIGIIGRNGAGKSTLLKILSRITTPTEGEVDIYGRVGSLLEVGTGFHPELTGKENIFLSGSILGMRKREIEQKFEEIVRFAEIERFIDTPVKRYSSGMYVRLAFAVAAHLDPEILLVDEVLAVGDIQFQKKCLGKMGNIAKGGRTILFVSHNMAAITNLCNNGIWLSNGNMSMMGPINEVVTAYAKSQTTDMQASRDLRQITDRFGPGLIGRLCFISIEDDTGVLTHTIKIDHRVTLTVGIDFVNEVRTPEIMICITTITGQRVTHISSPYTLFKEPIKAGVYYYKCSFNANFVPGLYSLILSLKTQDGQTLSGSDDWIENALVFEIIYMKSEWSSINP
jgi:lipopolysaccharide transport system ATP-binding protein